MKVLFIGGTGIISSASVRLALERGYDVTLLNRGKSFRPVASGAKVIEADIRDLEGTRKALTGHVFDVVAEFTGFVPEHIETDLALFDGKVGQYVYISSASAYQTPPQHVPVTEETPLDNPFWEYSRNKAACEARLHRAYAESDFPATIVRPSHTYDETLFPFHGGWTVMDRMLKGKPVIVHGDGTSLWTMTYNADFAKGFVGLFGKAEAIGQTYHITSDEWLTWNQIFESVANAFGVQPKLVHIPSDLIARFDPVWGDSLLGDKAHSFMLDNSKIKALVPDFICETPFREGVLKVRDWYLANPQHRVVDAEFNAIHERILAAYAKAWPEGKLPV
ncbi:MAG: SDR family oxidoreductase [Anaerolineaceae bacterium]